MITLILSNKPLCSAMFYEHYGRDKEWGWSFWKGGYLKLKQTPAPCWVLGAKDKEQPPPLTPPRSYKYLLLCFLLSR